MHNVVCDMIIDNTMVTQKGNTFICIIYKSNESRSHAIPFLHNLKLKKHAKKILIHGTTLHVGNNTHYIKCITEIKKFFSKYIYIYIYISRLVRVHMFLGYIYITTALIKSNK